MKKKVFFLKKEAKTFIRSGRNPPGETA